MEWADVRRSCSVETTRTVTESIWDGIRYRRIIREIAFFKVYIRYSNRVFGPKISILISQRIEIEKKRVVEGGMLFTPRGERHA